MARHSRVVLPNVAMHIVQRGNNRLECFKADADRLVYLSILRELSALTHCAIHAYCLMTNHVHLLLTPDSDAGPSLMMRDLARFYASYFNRRYQRTGTLWEGRFRSCLVESAAYVLACYRYIESNPVRAGMVSSPGAYPWSSHRANAARTRDPLISHHVEYRSLTTAAYSSLFAGSEEPAFLTTVRDATAGGYPLVGEAMKARLKLLGARTEPGKPGPRPSAVREPDMKITYLTPNSGSSRRIPS
jgi:putative transposase